ncbi:MAG: glycosyltransferase family 4 protein [Nitrosomonas sp.]|nr:glycosyltransferase family 4 protein [Nitrosomonas sp.]MCC7090901.1 glycosyltransferase family 4 protein [Nitrosomonas sp.]
MGVDFPLSAFTAPLLSFGIAFFSIRGLIKSDTGWALDLPNSRSLHSIPVPRVGGLGLLFAVMLSWIVFSVIIPIEIWVGISLLIAISLLDDIWHLPVWSRLLVHCLAAFGFSAMLLMPLHGWVIALCVSLAIIWMTNLYNFMDGSDGLAGGMTAIGFGYYGVLAYWMGHHDFATANFCVAAAALAFLAHNFHPARVFLGDAGAIPLGFLAAVFGILGWMSQIWPIYVPLLVFSPFIADSTVTLIKRLLRGENIWQAHREHYYQRMIVHGFGHRKTAVLSYGLMLAVGGSAVWAGHQESTVQYWVVIAWGGIYLILMSFADCNQKWHSDRG